jgi:hypothetical protein
MKIDQCVVRIWFDRPLAANVQGKDLRGAVAALVPEEPLFHQHDGDRLVYSYPKIQYKSLQGVAYLVGLAEGGAALGRINFLGRTFRLGGEMYSVESVQASFHRRRFGLAPDVRTYLFVSPWMALNERNFERYQMSGDPERRRDLLRRVLTGNLLSMSKGLGYTVRDRISVDFERIWEKPVRLKGTPMVGFKGSFAANFRIPNFWGIGKSTSRGFGAIQRVDGFPDD